MCRRVFMLPFVLVFVLLLAGTSLAEVPTAMRFQGYLTDTEGEPLSGAHTLSFTLYDADSGGNPVWTDTQSVALADGNFSVLLGGGGNPLDANVFDGAPLWLGVTVDEGEELSPRSPVGSVPYATRAGTADNVPSEQDILNLLETEAYLKEESDPTVNDLAKATLPCSPGDLVKWNGTSWNCGEDQVGSGGGADTLALMSCADGEVPMYGSSGWDCAPALHGYSCSPGEVLSYQGAAWECSDQFVTEDELQAAFPDSIDGMSGGTVTGDTTVVGVLSADTLVQNGNVVCDRSGNCGQTLADIPCETNEVLRYNGSSWVCSDAPAPMPEPCTGPNMAMQWDGSSWQCVNLRETGPSQGHALGYEAHDAWGYVWDGLARPAANWASANETCTGLGGRLPTITELYRINATSGTGEVGTLGDTNHLWTLISNYQNSYVSLRLSDGNVVYTSPASSQPYRCVWPDHASPQFNGDSCYGPVGSACAGVRRFYNMDKWDRPAVDMVAASHECNFYNASIPTVEDWTEVIHSGVLTGDWNNWLWAAELMYTNSSPYVLHANVRFDDARESLWYFDSYQDTSGYWNWATANVRFRCIGKRSATEGRNPEPSCNGDCFTVIPSPSQVANHAGRRAPIWADSQDRSASSHAQATSTCRSLGAALPTTIEFQELTHAGWPNGSNSWLWTASPIYNGNYQNLLARWSGTGAKTWYAQHSTSISWDPGNGSYGFRCVWHQTYTDTPPTCPLGQSVRWDGGSFSCIQIENGDDDGNATGGGWTDQFGNVWDRSDRSAQTGTSAESLCVSLDGRLPTATELHRVRQGGPDPIPNGSSTFIWTTLPSYRANYRTTFRLSDGASNDSLISNAAIFRCIWPISQGNIFGGKACSGDASDTDGPCFRAGRYVTDETDRAAVSLGAAAQECLLSGGWLTGLRDFELRIHAGAPNGNWSRYSWILEPMYASYFRAAIGRWNGTGDNSWYWNNQITSTGSLDYGHNGYPFRCVFHDILY